MKNTLFNNIFKAYFKTLDAYNNFKENPHVADILHTRLVAIWDILKTTYGDNVEQKLIDYKEKSKI